MLVPKRETIIKVHDHIIARLGGESGILKPLSRLDNAMARPRTVVYKHEPFKDVISKSAALAHGIISLHPFVDGNKRTGLNILDITLAMNGIGITYPPYIVKYSVQAALDATHRRYVNEDRFIDLILPLCSHSTFAQLRKRIRYNIMPQIPLRVYVFLAARFPKSRLILIRAEAIVLDWFAAGDRQILTNAFQEFAELQKKGYPKSVPPLEFQETDFEEIPSSGDRPTKKQQPTRTTS